MITRQRPLPAPALAGTRWQLALSAVFLAPLAALVDGAPPALDGRAVAGFAYLSLVATAGAFCLWFFGVRRLPVPVPPVLGLAAPLTGAALGWAVLGQDLTATQIAGFALSSASVVYAATRGSDDRPR